jgi:hypothetical protein
VIEEKKERSTDEGDSKRVRGRAEESFRYAKKGISGLTKYLVKGTVSTEARKYTVRKKKC